MKPKLVTAALVVIAAFALADFIRAATATMSTLLASSADSGAIVAGSATDTPAPPAGPATARSTSAN